MPETLVDDSLLIDAYLAGCTFIRVEVGDGGVGGCVCVKGDEGRRERGNIRPLKNSRQSICTWKVWKDGHISYLILCTLELLQAQEIEARLQLEKTLVKEQTKPCDDRQKPFL